MNSLQPPPSPSPPSPEPEGSTLRGLVVLLGLFLGVPLLLFTFLRYVLFLWEVFFGPYSH